MTFFIVLALLTLAGFFGCYRIGQASAVAEATEAAERELITILFRQQVIKQITVGELREFNIKCGDAPLTIRMDFGRK